jgi:hypothetical protein
MDAVEKPSPKQQFGRQLQYLASLVGNVEHVAARRDPQHHRVDDVLEFCAGFRLAGNPGFAGNRRQARQDRRCIGHGKKPMPERRRRLREGRNAQHSLKHECSDCSRHSPQGSFRCPHDPIGHDRKRHHHQRHG